MTLLKPLFIAGALLLTFAPVVGLADEILGQGQFSGKSSHETRGGVTLEKGANGFSVILQDDFFHDGAPDPKVVIGRTDNGERVQLSHLKANSGRQVYPIPADLDVSAYDEVWIWCKRYAVPLGHAPLGK
ncbi:DM13 domain-containing protein [Aestuariispira insulae]|uniref:Electron transfer DM13 n=1 Tax=Aestuariispira insulae TaxID=1461337 RepID=A0A3D9HVC3_9PROT|nr:DM13 domain-containing protein [Aestuariispira insulae]RED53474.1 electron transfer DM13 [Aestuariispira insulae]